MTLFAALRVANLPVAVAQRDTPTSPEVPLLLVERQAGQAVIAASSAPGVSPRMTLRQAQLRCPDAIVRPIDHAVIEESISAIRECLARLSPRVSLVASAPDLCFVLDLGRASQGRAMQWADQLIEMIWQTVGLLPSIGLAADPLMAQLAARVVPAGVATLIMPGQECSFLAPQPITLLPIPEGLRDRLLRFGLRTIGQVAALPKDALQAQFGVAGRQLAELVRAAAPAAFAPDHDAPKFTLGQRFLSPIDDHRAVLIILDRLAAHLARRLDTEAAGVGTLTLRIDLADGLPLLTSHRVNPPTADARRLAVLLHDLLNQRPPPGPIERLTITASDLTLRPTGQLSLFPSEHNARNALPALVERLQLYPDVVLMCAATEQQNGCLERQVRLEVYQ